MSKKYWDEEFETISRGELEKYQLELLNTMPSWSKKVALNIGKYYGFEIGKDVFITGCTVSLKIVKVK